MSAERSPERAPRPSDVPSARPDMAELRARRREARRRQRLARIDLGLGVFGALILLLATPGLAITGLIVLAILTACGISVVRERRRRRAAPAEEPPRATTPHAAGPVRTPRHSRERAARERTRSPR